MKAFRWMASIVYLISVIHIDPSQCTGNVNATQGSDGCMRLSDDEMAFSECRQYCTKDGGLLFTLDHLKHNTSKFYILLKKYKNTQFWIDDKNETSLKAEEECFVLYRNDNPKVKCKKREFCNCYYENSSVCSTLSETTLQTTLTIGTSDTIVSNDTTKSPPENHTVTIIIVVYVSGVLLIILGGIAVVKFKHRRAKLLDKQMEEQYYYYPPFDARSRPPSLCGQDQQPGSRSQRQIVFPGFPALANIQEVTQGSDPRRSPKPPPVKCGPTDRSRGVHVMACGSSCRPPPGLYTTLLNPIDESRSLTMQSDETLQELVENPLYGVTRL